VTGALSSVGDNVGSAAEKVGDTFGTAAGKAKVPALVGTAAAAGIVGGMALGSRVLSRGKGSSKVPMPTMRGKALKSVANEMQHVGKEIGKAGFRLGVGDLDMEVQRGKRSKDTRDSPLEVLLNGLTSRRSKRS
jgi:hypothetical protein